MRINGKRIEVLKVDELGGKKEGRRGKSNERNKKLGKGGGEMIIGKQKNGQVKEL